MSMSAPTTCWLATACCRKCRPWPRPLAIDAGGGAAGSYGADTDFAGGTPTSAPDPINTSGVTDPAPQAVYDSLRYGNFTYTIPNLTPGAAYTVRLHFAELYWGDPTRSGVVNGAGRRQFNVAINGRQVLSNFDIFATAGGKDIAVVEPFITTADSSGKITIQFTSVTGNAMINGIEILPAAALAIDAGGGAAGSYGADTDFAGGTPTSAPDPINTSGVTDPAPQAVYDSLRYGNFTYTIPNLTPGAAYTVRLHFAELYWGDPTRSGVVNGAGRRQFNVAINGRQVLSNFDIFATAGGKDIAVVEPFITTADSSGKITIQFTSVTGNAMINGIEILPAAALAIDAGGGAAGSYGADTDFAGGTPTSAPDPINTSGVTDPAPQAVYDSLRYGNFTYTIPNLTPGAAYTVRLHFAELYWGDPTRSGVVNGAGRRQFNVAINGRQVLSNFDIFATAGGKDIAVVEPFITTADSSGKITIQFTSVTGNAMINGIEILPAAAIDPSRRRRRRGLVRADTDFAGGTPTSAPIRSTPAASPTRPPKPFTILCATATSPTRFPT